MSSMSKENGIKLSVLLFAVAFTMLSSLTVGYFYGKYNTQCPVTQSVKTNTVLVGDSEKYLGDKKILLPPGFNNTIEGNEVIKQLYLAYKHPKENIIVLENTEMFLSEAKYVRSQNHLPTLPNPYGVVEPIYPTWGMRDLQIQVETSDVMGESYFMVFDGDRPIGKVTEKQAPEVFQAFLRYNE